eukprot:gene1283-1358_t
MFRLQRLNSLQLVRKFQSNQLRTITNSKSISDGAVTVEAAGTAAAESTDVPSTEFTKLQFRYTGIHPYDIKIQIARMKSIFTSYNLPWGYVRLPQEQETITLYRSPHVHKKAKDSYRKFTHKAIVTAKVPSYLALKIVRNASLNPLRGLHVSIKMTDY